MNAEEQHLRERSSGTRYVQLDALRGIAAICVLLYHTNRAFDLAPMRFYAELFFSGPQAVTLFFVLSGFVLALPYLEEQDRPYWPYLVRRFWRIWVPFAVAVAISAIGAIGFGGSHLPLTPWYYKTWHTPVTAMAVVMNLLMSSRDDLNTAFWSLGVEVQMSIVMPFLASAVRRGSFAMASLVLFTSVAAWPAISHTAGLPGNLLHLAQYGPLFLLGALLAKYRTRTTQFLLTHRMLSHALLLISLALYVDHVGRHTPFIGAFQRTNQAIIVGLGSAGLISCTFALPKFGGLLERPVPEYLGRISYSLYLTHSVVLFAGLDLLYGHVPVWAVVGIIILTAFPVAHVFTVLVEEPANRAGKRLAGGRKPALVRAHL